ncbi:MAG: hypothetical protein GY784_06880, partial [Gammaproteobacteria bacterium]|nr:hypothetical protein [Gammaproteobacteria bacterium]
MLLHLQQQLTDIYQVDRAHDVRDYLITDRRLANYLGRNVLLEDTDESLLVAQDDDDLELSLFLDGEMLTRLEASDPVACLAPELLDDWWKVIEGISHFNCVAWKASQDRTVTCLELELQAEIDKFVSTMLLAMEQSNRELMASLHGRLFEGVSFNSALDDEQLERYRSANNYASRYCHALRQQLIDDHQMAKSELRHFYRLQSP